MTLRAGKISGAKPSVSKLHNRCKHVYNAGSCFPAEVSAVVAYFCLGKTLD